MCLGAPKTFFLFCKSIWTKMSGLRHFFFWFILASGRLSWFFELSVWNYRLLWGTLSAILPESLDFPGFCDFMVDIFYGNRSTRGGRAVFQGDCSTKPGMASRELVYEEICVELAGLSNQILTSIRLGSWRPRKKESASPEKRKKMCTVSHLGPPNWS